MSSSEFRYTPFYCEENIWHLAQGKCFRGLGAFVVIIPGEGGHRRLWFQSLAEGRESPVFWDYHVLLLVFDNGWHVWDLDTTLGLPVHGELLVQAAGTF